MALVLYQAASSPRRLLKKRISKPASHDSVSYTHLRADGVKVRVVSVPSEGLFRSQSKEYQESVIPAGSKIFGLTAGLPVNLEGLVGANGKVWGLESFGFSAPYKVLDEKLGFTGQNVYNLSLIHILSLIT